MTLYIVAAITAFLLFIAPSVYGYKRDWFKFLVTLALGSILMHTLPIIMEMKV
jgi:hypothetical protein